MLDIFRKEQTWFRALIVFLIAVFLLESLFFVLYGNINLDEGQYLYAGRLVYEGKLPYRDFAHNKSPLLPYVYGLSQVLLGPSLLWGRLTSCLLSLVTAILVTVTAYRMGGRMAAVVSLLVLMTTSQFLWLFTVTKTDPLAISLAMLSLYFLLYASQQPRDSVIASSAMLWASAAKINYLLSFLLVLGVVLIRNRSRRWAAITILTAVGFQILLLAGPFLAQVPIDTLLFHLFASYLVRSTRADQSFSPDLYLELQLSTFWQNTISSYAFMILLGAILFYLALRQRRVVQIPRTPYHHYPLILSLAFLSYLPHLVPGYIFWEYFVHPLTMLSVALGVAASTIYARIDQFRKKAAIVAILSLLIGAQFLNSVHPARRLFHIESPELSELQQVAVSIREVVPQGERLFTFSPYLAVESGHKMLEGLELGWDAYFPLLSDSQASRYRVVNRTILNNLVLSEKIGAVLLTDHDLRRLAQEVKLSPAHPRSRYTEQDIYKLLPGLQDRYKLLYVAPEFGQGGHNLYILVRLRDAI